MTRVGNNHNYVPLGHSGCTTITSLSNANPQWPFRSITSHACSPPLSSIRSSFRPNKSSISYGAGCLRPPFFRSETFSFSFSVSFFYFPILFLLLFVCLVLFLSLSLSCTLSLSLSPFFSFFYSFFVCFFYFLFLFLLLSLSVSVSVSLSAILK